MSDRSVPVPADLIEKVLANYDERRRLGFPFHAGETEACDELRALLSVPAEEFQAVIDDMDRRLAAAARVLPMDFKPSAVPAEPETPRMKPMINPNGGGRWCDEDREPLLLRLEHARAEVDASRNLPLSVLRDLVDACREAFGSVAPDEDGEKQ